ncbi:fungal-specific transcription factor domain-containing protein [Mycena haematopus]|nr:fungal-specific transcription factor domain-containing protein [Mycena haematopus]
MPAAPKQSKKPGAPKAKGAVRAKSGCYTCRIRRKKCDEHQNQDGHCETCVRLRLQCLGFGAKRPEWLRESRNVIEMRDKIKVFLAAQGMIKGHSGAAHRGAEQELPILQLEDDTTPSSSVSPPTPTLSLSPSEPSRPLQHESAIRDQHWIVASYSNHVNQMPADMHNPMRGTSPFDGSSHSSHADLYPTSYNSSNSLAWTNQNGSRLIEPAPRPHSHTMVRLAPPMASSFSGTYHMNYDDESYYAIPIDEDTSCQDFSAYLYTLPSKPGGLIDDLVTHYLSNVMDLQYLLVDPIQMRNILTPAVSHHSVARDAARLLAAIHRQRANYRSHTFVALQNKETKYQYEKLLEVLRNPEHTQDDALAAISMISSFLFDGGAGEWQQWLKVSYDYASVVFGGRDPRDTLLTCDETTRFIIKTSIWFDVLAAVTTQEPPRFLHYIRALYSPEASGIYDPSLAPAPELSMMSVMGCENHVVWALAEASALAVWKREHQARGTLSVPDLVARASELDNNYLNASPSTLIPPPPYGATTPETETQLARELSNNIFRAATRVYVRSIVSGDYPHVPEIIEAVDETMGYLRMPAQHSSKVHSSVVRSTVFGFFICGALTDKSQTRQEVLESLSLSREDLSHSTVGNSATIKKLLEKIWMERRAKNSPLRWRDMLKQAKILLV